VTGRGARGAVVAVALGLGLGLAACGGAAPSRTAVAVGGTTTSVPTTIRVTSPAFGAGGPIPRAYTCDGADLPVPVRWSGVPASATSLSLVMRDIDAPGGNFIHWRVERIPPTVTHIGGGASLPLDAVAGRNSFGSAGYRGPCPPRGDHPHHYVVTLIALNREHDPVDTGALAGTYGR
jgi:Raf kinase inhibitor-like YbhB/YbcL family protein